MIMYHTYESLVAKGKALKLLRIFATKLTRPFSLLIVIQVVLLPKKRKTRTHKFCA